MAASKGKRGQKKAAIVAFKKQGKGL